MTDCIFCNITTLDYLAETNTLFAIYDKYPVTIGHILIIPKVHRQDFFELTSDEQKDLFDMIHQLKIHLEKSDPSISGFNIGANCGESAGQTIFHCHIHLIPRRHGDLKNPTGGVRGVIPSKRIY